MDEGLSKAVLKVFVTLYEQGLIYKDKRLVNWDPGLLTAISDLEVEQRETNVSLAFQLSAGRWQRSYYRRHHAARNHAGRYRRCRAS